MNGYTFGTTIGSVTVTTTLYGDLTTERIVAERAAARHRAEQLQPVTVKTDRPVRPMRVRDDEDDDPVWDKQSYQSTGR